MLLQTVLLCSWQTLSTAVKAAMVSPHMSAGQSVAGRSQGNSPQQGSCRCACPLEAPVLSCPPLYPAAAAGHETMTCAVLHSAGLQTSTAAMLDEVLLQGGSKRHTPSVALFHTPALRGLLKRWAPVAKAATQRSTASYFQSLLSHVWERCKGG